MVTLLLAAKIFATFMALEFGMVNLVKFARGQAITTANFLILAASLTALLFL